MQLYQATTYNLCVRYRFIAGDLSQMGSPLPSLCSATIHNIPLAHLQPLRTQHGTNLFSIQVSSLLFAQVHRIRLHIFNGTIGEHGRRSSTSE